MPRSSRTRLRARLLAALLLLSVVLLLWPGPLAVVLRTFIQLVVPLQHTLRSLEPETAPREDPLSGPQAAALRQEVLVSRREATALAARLQVLEAENQALSGLRRQVPDGVLIPALVVAHDSAAYRESGLIDRGRLAGVWRDQQVVSRSVNIETAQADALRPDLSVLSQEALIGEVVDTSPYTARVLLITDPASRLRLVRTARETPNSTEVSDFELMLYGAGNGRMEIRDIEYRRVQNGEIQVFDAVFTDSADSRLPASIQVGRITDLRRDDNNPALYTAIVDPAFDLRTLKKVYVFNPAPGVAQE